MNAAGYRWQRFGREWDLLYRDMRLAVLAPSGTGYNWWLPRTGWQEGQWAETLALAKVAAERAALGLGS